MELMIIPTRLNRLFVPLLIAMVTGLCIPALAETFTSKVVDVSAGHIFEIRHEGKRKLVVLYGVESPSSKTIAGKQAKEFATHSILKKQVEVRVVERRDEITFVEIRLEDGRNLGHVMLRKGLVRWDTYTAPGDDGLQELQQLAKDNHRGLWYPTFDPNQEPPQLAPPEVGKVDLLRTPARGQGYHITEGHVTTDESGVKTLVLKGNGQKQVGFEAAVQQRRIDAHMEFQAEQQRIENERLRKAEEAARRAAEQAAQDRQQELLLETQRMLMENAARPPEYNNDVQTWSSDTGWQ